MAYDEGERRGVGRREEVFNGGILDALDGLIAEHGFDHQHPDEPSLCTHLKEAVSALRTAFADLHFEISWIIGEDDWVALHAIMTGAHQGEIRRPIMLPDGVPMVPATGRPVHVPHTYLIRFENGKGAELWHVMDILAMLGQLGLLPSRERAHA